MGDDYMAKVERDWSNADYRDSIIEECARVAQEYLEQTKSNGPLGEWTAAAIRALKDKP